MGKIQKWPFAIVNRGEDSRDCKTTKHHAASQAAKQTCFSQGPASAGFGSACPELHSPEIFSAASFKAFDLFSLLFHQHVRFDHEQ